MIEIRQMEINDYEEVYYLWEKTEGMGLNPIDDSFEGIEKYLKRNPSTCFCAEVDGVLAGVIMAGHDGRRGYIYHTAVKKQYRGMGIGKRLVQSAVKALETEGICKAALVVFEDNALGNAFWEKMGFTVRNDLVYRNKVIKKGD